MRHLYFILSFLAFTSLSAQENRFEFNYFGQTPPDTIAKEFIIPSYINDNYNFISSISFSPSGKMIVFGVTDSTWSTNKIVFTDWENGTWTKIDTLSSCKTGVNANPTFQTDSIIYFTSWREGQTDLDIFKITRSIDKWGNITKVNELSIDTCREFMGSCSQNGELYFVRLEKLKRPDKNTIMNNEIYCSNLANGEVKNIKNVGRPINSEFSEVSPYIESNGKYLLFGSRRECGLGLVDIYVSFRDTNGDWKEPKNVKELNSKEFDSDPVVTPDGKYIFYKRRQDYICTIPNRIYWISTRILEKYNE
jgi:hypothetical protein